MNKRQKLKAIKKADASGQGANLTWREQRYIDSLMRRWFDANQDVIVNEAQSDLRLSGWGSKPGYEDDIDTITVAPDHARLIQHVGDNL